jgi:hypothetical protein
MSKIASEFAGDSKETCPPRLEDFSNRSTY